MNKSEFEEKLTDYYHKQSGLLHPDVDLKDVIDKGWESEIYVYDLAYGPASARTYVKRALRLFTGGDFKSAKGEFKTLSL